MDGLQATDGGGERTKALAAERSLIDLDSTEGLSFEQAVQNASGQLVAARVRSPRCCVCRSLWPPAALT
jgi:hypothetical protein